MVEPERRGDPGCSGGRTNGAGSGRTVAMTRKKWALILLIAGVSCLIGYILLLFHGRAPALTVALLVLSILCNAVAVNLLFTAKPGKKDEEDA